MGLRLSAGDAFKVSPRLPHQQLQIMSTISQDLLAIFCSAKALFADISRTGHWEGAHFEGNALPVGAHRKKTKAYNTQISAPSRPAPADRAH
jgi:hypothetical protein